MEIHTLNVGQGQFVVVTGATEAVIVDSYVPLSSSKQEIEFIRKALPQILRGKFLVGLMITGFDDDHFCEVGLGVILYTYFPKWIMYPKYKKETANAGRCFRMISSRNGLARIPVELSNLDYRFFGDLSRDFSFEVFSPHTNDMSSSNNSSLVCKIVERSTGKSYLVTGDTENERWDSMTRIFHRNLKADVLAVPHHGSDHGITSSAIQMIAPDTALISAGVRNPFGHPEPSLLRILQNGAREVHSTNWGGGQSLRTDVNIFGIQTYKSAF